MSKKTKKALVPIILIILLAALIIGYVVLKKANDKAAEEANAETEEVTIPVLDKSKLTMTSFSISNEKDDRLNFTYVNDNWQWEEDEKYPLDTDKIDSIVEALNVFNAKLEVANPSDDMSEYGLEDSKLVIKAAYSDGSSFTYTFGSVNGYNSYQYFKLSTDASIYMIDSSIADTFDISLDDLYKKQSSALVSNTITNDKVTSIIVETEGGQSNEITDETGIVDLFELVYSMNLNDWEDYYAESDEMLNTYGINPNGDKVTVYYTTEETVTNDDGTTSNVNVPHTYTVYIGHRFENDNGYSGYYYSIPDSTVVYAQDSETVEKILNYLTYVPVETTATEEDSENLE